MSQKHCPLCDPVAAEQVLWADQRCRVILAAERAHPALCRVIWRQHVAEMTDLSDADRRHLLRIVLAVEKTLRRVTRPAKINLASLGNQVPHLHWHVVPRYRDDAHYPDSIWAPARRRGVRHAVDAAALAEALDRLVPQPKKKAGRKVRPLLNR